MANRGLSAGAITETGGKSVEMFKLLRIDFSTTIYLTTATHDIDYDDGDGVQTYTSTGTLLSIPDVTESLKIKPETLRISLSGATAANFPLLLAEAKGAPVHISNYLSGVGEGFIVFKGFTDSYSTSEDGQKGNATVDLSVVNHWANWDAKTGTYLSDVEQQRLYSGDLGLEFSKMTDFFLPYWGVKGGFGNLLNDSYYAPDYVVPPNPYGAYGFDYIAYTRNVFMDELVNSENLPDTLKLPVVYGQGIVQGVPVFRTITDVYSDTMWCVYALAEGECDSLIDITFDGVSYLDAKYSGNVTAYFKSGSTTQAAQSNLVSESALWTTAHQLKGICYVAIKYLFDENLFGANEDPSPVFEVKGKKLYDPRTTNTIYSKNPALVLYDYLRATRYGKGLVAGEIDGINEAANYCDTNVTDNTGGTPVSIRLFEFHGIISTTRPVKKNVEAILFTMRAHLPWVSGKYTVVIERHDDASVFTIDSDMVTDSFTVKETGVKQLANVMYYTIADAEANYAPFDIISESSTYLALDGRELKKSIKNQYEDNRYRAQNRANTELKKSRQTITVEMTCGNSEAIKLQTGEIVDITRPVHGWSGKEFRIVGMKLLKNGNVKLSLHEYESTVYDWEVLPVMTPPSDTNLPSPLDILPPTALVLTSGTAVLQIKDDGTIVSRIKATWTPPVSLFVTGYNIYIKSPTDATKLFYKFVKGYLSDEAFIDIVEDGITYTIYVHAVNTYGAESIAVSDTETVIGKSAPPANVTGFVAAPNGDIVVFKWHQVADLDLAGYEIRYAKAGVGTWADATQLTAVTRGTNVTSADVPPDTWDFYIKAVDTTGNYSTTATKVSSVLVESDRNVIIQTPQSPFVLAEYKAVNLSDPNTAATNGMSAVYEEMTSPVYDVSADIFVKKDAIGKATRWVSFGIYWYGGTGVPQFYVGLDTATGETGVLDSTGLSGTPVVTVIEYTDYWKLSISCVSATTNHTTLGFSFQPAAGSGSIIKANESQILTGNCDAYGMHLRGAGGEVISSYDTLLDYTVVRGLVATATTIPAPIEVLGTMTNFVVHHTGKLIPKSQNLASADGWDTFDTFVVNPYATCTYTAPEIDILFDDKARIWGSIDSVLGVGETAGNATPQLSIDYRLDAGSYDGFEDWGIGEKELRFCKHKLTVDTTAGVAMINEFTPTVDQIEHIIRPLDVDGKPTSIFIPAAGSTIVFETPFHEVPYVMSQVEATSARVSMISAVTTTSFFVRVYNANGTAVDGYIFYEAKGV